MGACGESMTSWHPPVVNGCRTGHEHGDAPPRWIAEAGYPVEFNISSHENTVAHAAMKGFNAHLGDVDVYLRVHATSNAIDRSERFHSYEVWARDSSGVVSHWQGWMNAGDPGADRVPRRPAFTTDVKPSILVVDERSWEQGIHCEQWYGATAPWSWDIGISLCDATTIYYYGEAAETDSTYWRPAPGDAMESDRRIDISWFDFRDHPTGNLGINDASIQRLQYELGFHTVGPNGQEHHNYDGTSGEYDSFWCEPTYDPVFLIQIEHA